MFNASMTFDLGEAMAWLSEQVHGDQEFWSALTKGIADQVPEATADTVRA